ncbi:MAG: ATPase, partial [Mariniphaga sp.]|nr:ATPase [Mariniphaga sp.]
MKFYNRVSELAELERIRNLSFNDFSRMTVVTGRRRIGKTSLVMKSVENTPTVYLFVGRKNEASL